MSSEEPKVCKTIVRCGRARNIADWPTDRSCFANPIAINFMRLTGQGEIRVDPDLSTRLAERMARPARRHHFYANRQIAITGNHAHALVYSAAQIWKSTDLGMPHHTEYGRYDFWLHSQADNNWLNARVKRDFQ
jgi:hypothetical protein